MDEPNPQSLYEIFKHVKTQTEANSRLRISVFVLSLFLTFVCVAVLLVLDRQDDNKQHVREARETRQTECRAEALAVKFDTVIDGLPLGATDAAREEALRSLKEDDSLTEAYEKCNRLP